MPEQQTPQGYKPYVAPKPDRHFLIVYHPEPTEEEPNPDPEGIELCIINAFTTYGAENIFVKEMIEVIEVMPDSTPEEETDESETPSFYAGGTGAPPELPNLAELLAGLGGDREDESEPDDKPD